MYQTTTFITVAEIKTLLDISESKAYHVIRDLNKELSQRGFMVIQGRVSRQYFNERFYGVSEVREKGGCEDGGL
ncbi:MAG: DNA-binding protein [Eubacteriales bacterium]